MEEEEEERGVNAAAGDAAAVPGGREPAGARKRSGLERSPARGGMASKVQRQEPRPQGVTLADGTAGRRMKEGIGGNGSEWKSPGE